MEGKLWFEVATQNQLKQKRNFNVQSSNGSYNVYQLTY